MLERLWKFFAAAALCAAAASCAKEERGVEYDIESGLIPFTVSVSLDTGTKSHLEFEANSAKVIWNEGDEIAVVDDVSDELHLFTLVPGSINGRTARFTGMIAANAARITAAYPYSAVKCFAGEEFSFNLKSSQTASAQSCDADALLAVSSFADKSAGLSFKNKVGLLAVPVPDGVVGIFAESLDGQPLAGQEQVVSLSTDGSAGKYCIAVLPGVYRGLRLIVTTASGRSYMVEKQGEFNLPAGKIINCGSGVPFPCIEENEVCIIRDEAELSAFLESAEASTKLRAFIFNDIECQEVLPQAAAFSGLLDGCGHNLTLVPSATSLFASNDGTIRNLTIDGGPLTPSAELVFGVVACRNGGIIENVVNSASVSYTSNSLDEPLCFGGIAGISTGSLKECQNDGAVTVDVTGQITGASAVAGIAGYNAGEMSWCTNNAAVTLSAASISKLAGMEDIAAAVPVVGGISGYGAAGFSAEACTNNGDLTFSLNAAESGVPAEGFSRMGVAGIAAAPCGPVKGCTNNGRLDVTVAASSKGTPLEVEMLVCVGGIAGADWFFTSKSGVPCDTEVISCTNTGEINVYTDAPLSNSTVGGIFGWPGQEAPHELFTRDCVNSGEITVRGTGKVRVGGIQGGTGNIDECTNVATVRVESANENTVLGGIAGFHSQNHQIRNSVNTGDVISGAALQGVGGLVGNIGNTENATGEGCKVNCRVVNRDSSSPVYTGMVVGKYNGTKTNSLGSSTARISVQGSIDTGKGSTPITATNYKTYLCGSLNSTSNHNILAQFADYDPEGNHVSGHIKWSDGSPAPGISVSDGFSVAVTDSDGAYSLKVTSDCRYIYFSYPSTAAITKNADTGCPDFFSRYSAGTATYDFTLKRQPVEDEFYLFAMADPQAHYKVLGNQSKAATTRFKEESVPAFNAEAASLDKSVYGVTLGDIVYSEGTRNSNSGMTTMRSNFKLIDFPVFQTIGNHDFTYFSSGSPLKTDATTSTLYLAAQRKFEDCFGPINYSFNRGDVHVVCMRNINYDSNTDAASYHCGYTSDQYAWLKADLANVSYDKMVILCGHIPLVSNEGKENVRNIAALLSKYTNSTVFSGHTHYYRGAADICGSKLFEHIHSAVCGQWWWSKIEGDGCPNGYTVYHIDGASIRNAWFKGVNDKMNSRDYQMRIYRGDLKCGGSTAYFKWPYSSSTYLINVFNGDSRWKIKVYEDGVYAGDATLIKAHKQSIAPISKGTTYTVDVTSSQDWWAIGYHEGVMGRGTSSDSYQTSCHHMWKWVATKASAKISVKATDAYGNTYTCSDVMTTLSYPDYIKMP